MSLVRTFLAVDLDGPFLEEVAALVHRLRGASRPSGARWVAPDTMHVTLRFFGDTNEAQLASLRAVVGELGQGARSVVLRAASVSGFPARDRAHVLILDVDDDDGLLASLAARAEAAATALGFVPEKRAYHPHLTLARMRKAADVASLAGEAASLPAGRVTALTLYASTTSATGPVYSPLERVTLLAP